MLFFLSTVNTGASYIVIYRADDAHPVEEAADKEYNYEIQPNQIQSMYYIMLLGTGVVTEEASQIKVMYILGPCII